MLDVTKLNISSRLYTIDDVFNDLKLNFEPSAWDDHRKSQFIETIIMRIPINNIYWYWNNDNIKIILGNERLSALNDFMQNKFKLTGLQFMDRFEGKSWNELERPFQRRIIETNISVISFDHGTSKAELDVVIKMICNS